MERKSPVRICDVEGCERKHEARGYCKMHWHRAHRSGALPPPLTFEERFWAKVEKTDRCWIWTGDMVAGHGYGIIAMPGTQGRKRARAHRLSYEWAHGPIPNGMLVDHICHNKACVNPDHLRLATVKQNQENLIGARSNSKSGVRGVCWDQRTKRWIATVGHNGKHYWCGRHDSLEQAEAAVIAKRNELFTHNVMDRVA